MSTSKLAEVMHSEPCVACSHFSKSRVSSGNSGCLQKTKETSHNAHWFRSPVRFYPTPSIQSLPVCKSPVVQTSLPSQCWKCALETSSNNRKKRLEIAKFTIFSTRQWLLPTSWCCPSLHHKVFQDISRYFKIFATGKKVRLWGGCLGAICCPRGFAFQGWTSALAHRWQYFIWKCLSQLAALDGDGISMCPQHPLDQPSSKLLLHQEVSLHLGQALPYPHAE